MTLVLNEIHSFSVICKACDLDPGCLEPHLIVSNTHSSSTTLVSLLFVEHNWYFCLRGSCFLSACTISWVFYMDFPLRTLLPTKVIHSTNAERLLSAWHCYRLIAYARNKICQENFLSELCKNKVPVEKSQKGIWTVFTTETGNFKVVRKCWNEQTPEGGESEMIIKDSTWYRNKASEAVALL